MKMGYILIMIGAGIGALGGWLYWKYIGCTTGTCPITARPLTSTLYGALIGALLFNAFTPAKKTINKTEQQQTQKDDRNA